jgi:rod shape-determining protein MreD
LRIRWGIISQMITGTLLLSVPLMLLLAVWQTAVGPHFVVWGIEPQLVLLTAVSWGLLHGPEEGAAWGLVGGLWLDLFSAGPFGLSAVAMVLVCGSTAVVQHYLPPSRFILPPLMGALGTILYFTIQILLLSLTGWNITFDLASQLPPLALAQGIIIIPIYWLLYALHQRLYPQII